ncbi:amino acid transmembrane transporter [Aureococcus anophagefferens]|nr:amino acid transmembrane transporter [Aureococcus anophagefferens]
MAVFEAPLSLTTKLQKLHFLNALGNALVAFALVVVAAYALKTLAREGPRADVTYGFAPLGSTLTFAGITVFAFEGTAPIVVPVCDATASKHRGRMTALTVATVASVARLRLLRIVCYLAFGEVNVIASQSLPSTPWPGGAVRGVYVVVVLLTFPLQLFPVTDMFDASGERPRAAAASRVGLVFFLAALAVAFEHKLDHVVSLLGALACAPLGLIVGPWMHLSIAAASS